LPFDPVKAEVLLQPAPEVQPPLRVREAPFAPLAVEFQLVEPLPPEIEPECDQVLPEFVVVEPLNEQFPPEQFRLNV
jgi:hypothetical protein